MACRRRVPRAVAKPSGRKAEKARHFKFLLFPPISSSDLQAAHTHFSPWLAKKRESGARRTGFALHNANGRSGDTTWRSSRKDKNVGPCAWISDYYVRSSFEGISGDPSVIDRLVWSVRRKAYLMNKKRSLAVYLSAMLIAAIAPSCLAAYTTDWLANTFGTNSTRVGSVARSMWVAPEGIIYTASMWDENEGGVAIYANGQSIASIGGHGEFQGSAITGNAMSIFVALQYSATYGSGMVGRYDRTSRARDLLIPVSTTTTEKRADVVTGLATSGALLYASDFPGNRVRVYTLAITHFDSGRVHSPVECR